MNTERQPLRLTNDEIDARKQYLRFTEADTRRIVDVAPVLRPKLKGVVIDAFQTQIVTFRDPAQLVAVVQREGRLDSVLDKVAAACDDFLVGKIDTAYTEKRMVIGRVHARIGLEPRWYLGALNLIQQGIAAILCEEPTLRGSPRAMEAYVSLSKIIAFDMMTVLDAYTEHSLKAVVHAQEVALRELSSPVIEVWDQVLVLPLVGTMDTRRAQEVTETLLNAVDARRAAVVIIDITGLPVMDTSTADYLFKTVRAVELLGSVAIVTGVRPAIAQMIVSLGIDASTLRTRARLSDGLRLALELTGRAVVDVSTASRAAALDANGHGRSESAELLGAVQKRNGAPARGVP